MNKYFSLIYSGEIHKGSKDKVIPAEAFGTLLNAASILEKAKSDVQLYLKKNKEECAQLLKEAREEGFNQGLTEFNKHILYFEKTLKQHKHELQKKVLSLALEAAKKIVGHELKTEPGTIVDIVKNSLKTVAQNYHIQIFVSKQDRELLEEKRKELKTIFEHAQTFIIQERDDITPGGCIIETEAGIINATSENQWRAIESAFKAFMKQQL